MTGWKEGQLVRAVCMALNGASAQAIADATGKDVWMIRNKLAFHGVSIMMPGTRAIRCVPVCLPAPIHDAIGREAERRGFSHGTLAARIAEIVAAENLFDAVLGDHREGAR